MKNKMFQFIEMVYMVFYLFIALMAGIILYPFSFLIEKYHHEESGYDL